MARGAQSVEHAGRAEQERARADRGRPRRGRVGGANPRHDRAVELAADADAARNTHDVGGRDSVEHRVGVHAQHPLSLTYGRASAPTKTTCAPGSRERTSYGPIASRAVRSSNRGIAICMEAPP